jgi:gas vesicle protein
MANISQLKRELAQFEVLKTKMTLVSSKLNDASVYANQAHDTLDNNYNINDDGSVLSNGAENLGKDLAETSNYLKNTVNPAIDSRMEEIKSEIQRLEEEEKQRIEAMNATRISSSRFSRFFR